MEIKVTDLVKHFNYADAYEPIIGSQAELGSKAAQVTWSNALAYAEAYPLLTTPDEIQTAREHFLDYGAWEESELDDETVQGLAVQEVCSPLWETRDMDDDEKKEYDENQGGRLFQSGDDWYFYFGC